MTMAQAVMHRIRALLKEREISLHKFLKDNCIPRSTITNLERGHTKSPTISIVFQVANGFGMTHLEFLDDPIFFNDELEFI